MKFSKLALIGIIPIVALIFFACQKADLKNPSTTSDAKGGGGGSNPPPTVFYDAQFPTTGTICAGATTYSFDVAFTNHGGGVPGGTTSVESWIYNGTTLVATATTLTSNAGTIEFTLNEPLTVGVTYTVKVQFHHANGNADVQNPIFSFSLTVDDSVNCTGGTGGSCYNGATLTQNAVAQLSNGGDVVNVTNTYTVCNCSGGDLNSLKLQGGLVSKAISASGYPTNGGGGLNVVFTNKSNKGNTVYSWTFDLPAGACHTFNTSYSVWPVACDGPVTGPWSLKYNGVAIGVAPAQQYIDPLDPLNPTNYLDRAYYRCTVN